MQSTPQMTPLATANSSRFCGYALWGLWLRLGSLPDMGLSKVARNGKHVRILSWGHNSTVGISVEFSTFFLKSVSEWFLCCFET